MFKKVSVVCLIVYLCAMFSSCADFDEPSKPLPTTTSPIITRYDLKELKQNTIEVSEKTLTDLDIVTEHDKFVLLNNKKDQFYPYKDGYIYPIEKGGKDGPNDMLVYDDRQGNITERGDLGCIEKIIDDSIYYTGNHGCLKCNEKRKCDIL